MLIRISHASPKGEGREEGLSLFHSASRSILSVSNAVCMVTLFAIDIWFDIQVNDFLFGYFYQFIDSSGNLDSRSRASFDTWTRFLRSPYRRNDIISRVCSSLFVLFCKREEKQRRKRFARGNCRTERYTAHPSIRFFICSLLASTLK